MPILTWIDMYSNMYTHMLAKRTNILFDQAMWDKLIKLSKEQEKSVGELVRKAIGEYYDLHNDILKQIQSSSGKIEKKRKHFKGRINYKSLIDYGRKS